MTEVIDKSDKQKNKNQAYKFAYRKTGRQENNTKVFLTQVFLFII